ncbi:hypothetical protein ACLMJK_003190 [Lecanora helva]
MHILLTNDDGPPSSQASPYIHSFCQHLQEAGHIVSVILPHEQRSWIGKAHFVGQVTKPSYYRPGAVHEDDGTVHARPLSSDQDGEEWVLVNGTPATCAQLGLYHFFQDRPPVDLVVSGPNYGRNSTSLFSLSSGTIGGAMEAAVCQKKAIALSFAFWSRDHDPNLIAGACRHSLKLIEYLYSHWDSSVDLYSVNVPIIAEVENRKVVVTHALQNYWTSGSSFQEIEAVDDDEEDPQVREQEIRENVERTGPGIRPTRQKHRHFKWAPKFTDIQKSIDASEPGNDGWAISQKYTSVTPLKANYMHSPDIPLGELKLPAVNSLSIPPLFHAIIDAGLYIRPMIHTALSKYFQNAEIRAIDSSNQLQNSNDGLLQITPYEATDFDHLLQHPTTSLANSYVIRKALIRKHYLHNTIISWWSKHPNDHNLKGHIPLTVSFEVDYAEFLDEALVECWELHESFAKDEREWWILKPSMSDQGQGVRLFSSEEELRSIFEEWEQNEESEDEGNTETPPTINGRDVIGAGTMTSQLRYFIAQRYVNPPLLLKSHENRKFHIRSYVLAVGALRTYVYKEMLALFAPLPYCTPQDFHPNTDAEVVLQIDSRIHLTNTCLQDGSREGSVVRFWDLQETPSSLPESWKTLALEQICAATGTLFEAAAREQMIHFQTLENAFEVFGLDWIIDEKGTVWLLEVNAFPDFKQSGEDLKDVIQGLWNGVVDIAVKGFFCPQSMEYPCSTEETHGMRKVLDVDLGRR